MANSALAGAEEIAPIASASARDARLEFHLRGNGPVRLIAFPLYANTDKPETGIVVWEGALAGHQQIAIDRMTGDTDRLFRKYHLVNAAAGAPAGSQRFIEDLAPLPATPPALAWPASIKGISCPVDVKDLADLGVRHTHINLNAAALVRVDERKRDETFCRTVDGRRIYFDPVTVRKLDRSIRELTEAGINILGVITNPIDAPGVLTHPKSDLAHAPNHMGAFNLTDNNGVNAFRALIEFLSARYCRGDKQSGSVGGWIIGNEVNSHWEWHNLGPATLDEIARQYVDELRLAYLAVRNAGADVPVFASFDHFWTIAASKDSRRHLGTRPLLDAMAALTAREGKFPWHIAQHPYPESLFQPRFWNDKTATFSFDAPRITFRNVEVLAAYLRRPEMLCVGKPRRLVFSEQGFHAGNTPAAEQVQAAAYALAYRRLSQIPGVEAFILHRHVDAAHEGGLKLGVWAENPRRKRPIWDVLKSADTPQWKAASDFALPIVGLTDWSQAKPRAGPFS